MTPDERLDQLEPLLSEAMAILDRHTAQLKQHTGLLTHITSVVGQQNDNIVFLLREQAEMKAKQTEMQQQLSDVQTQVSDMQTQVSDMQTSMGSKLDLILTKLGS